MIIWYLQTVALYFIILLISFWKFLPCMEANGWIKDFDDELKEKYKTLVEAGFTKAFKNAFVYCWVPGIRFFFFAVFLFAAFVNLDKLRGEDE